MAGIQLSGLASGFDWKSVVDQLMSLNRVPQDKLRTNKATNLGKLASFATLRTKVGSLQTDVKALSADALLGQRKAAIADADSTWSASAASRSVTGEYTFNVTTLATTTQSTGATNRAGKLSETNDIAGLVVGNLRLSTEVTDGVFTINGEQITVAATDSLQDVFARIATATGTVTATYDASTDRVSLAGTGVITLGSGADTSNFLYALKLYNNGADEIRSATKLGAIDLNEAIDDAGLATAITAVDGNGSFEINGTTIAYNVNTDSLRTIISRINDSAAGVTLTYDTANDRFRLTNKNTGDLGLSVSEDPNGLLAALGLTPASGGDPVARGANAVFTVNNGGTIVSASNTFVASMHGLTGLSVTADTTGTQTVKVEADTAAVEAGVRSFVAKFNDVQKFIDEQTKITVGSDGNVTAAQFASNREFSAMARSLRDMVFDEVPGLTGAFTRLESLGIDFEGTSSQLAVRDGAKLSSALANNAEDVAALFSTPTVGFTARMNVYIERLSLTGGILDTQEGTIETQNTALDKQIADLDRRLEAERTRLESGFIRMEQAQSLINSQLASLNGILNLK